MSADLIDTSVLVDALRGDERAGRFLDELGASRRPGCPDVVLAEWPRGAVAGESRPGWCRSCRRCSISCITTRPMPVRPSISSCATGRPTDAATMTARSRPWRVAARPGRDVGYLIIFDRAATSPWEERGEIETVRHAGVAVTVVRA